MNEKVFTYRGKIYPQFIKEWKMSQYITPFAEHFCKGHGIDVGAGENPFPGAFAVDITDGNEWHAMNIPAKDNQLDYIFSSHCLEHTPNFVLALEYWISKLKPGGVLFLYLPHWDMEYWRPWGNRKHIHQFEPKHLRDCLPQLGLVDVIVSEKDLASSFCCVGFKPKEV